MLRLCCGLELHFSWINFAMILKTTNYEYSIIRF